MNIMKTPCAFHKDKFISHFCQGLSCLLPLCHSCIPIHQNQHLDIKDLIKIVPIDQQINNIQQTISKQNARIQDFYRQTLKNVEKSLSLHANIKKLVFQQQNQVLNAINSVYKSILEEISNSIKRKQSWFRQFTSQINLTRTQLINIQNSLNTQKYLRCLIMWNKLKPHQIIKDIIRNQKVEWDEPTYQKLNILDLMKKVSQSKNLQMLEITGDMGLGKVLKCFNVLRFGDDQQRSPRQQSGILITAEKKDYRKLNSVRSAQRL